MASVDITLQQLYDMIKGGTVGVPIGTIVDYYGTTAPNGWLICDGRAVPDSMPDLKALIGNNTPDLRGRFRRMIGGNAAGMGIVQDDAIRNIVGYFNLDGYPGGEPITNGAGTGAIWLDVNTSVHGWSFSKNGGGVKTGDIHFDASKVVPTADENRPVNMAFNTIIFGGGVVKLLFTLLKKVVL